MECRRVIRSVVRHRFVDSHVELLSRIRKFFPGLLELEPMPVLSLCRLGPEIELVGHRRDVDAVRISEAWPNGLGALLRHFTPTSRVAVAQDVLQSTEAETRHVAALCVCKENLCASGDGIVGHTAPHKG